MMFNKDWFNKNQEELKNAKEIVRIFEEKEF